jgi:hypothetical protein
MKMRHSTAAIAMVILLACYASTALAQNASPGGGIGVTIPSSSIASPTDAGVRAHTNVRFLSPANFSPDFSSVRPTCTWRCSESKNWER